MAAIPNVVMVDSGGANIASVRFALERLGVVAPLTADPETISRASHVILPGVGAAGDAMAKLTAADGLVDCLRSLRQPVIGFCLGMQLLYDYSEEGGVDMLGLIEGKVSRFADRPGLTVPHMGWNTVSLWNAAHPLFKDLTESSYFYFVHSYRADTGAETIGTCTYDAPFTAITAKGNVMGCQFHPERSGTAGATIIRNFLEL